MKKKNVLLFMGKVDMGGIENLFLNVIPLLASEFEFHILYYVDGENELGDQFEALGCKLHKVGCDRYKHPLKFIKLIRNYIAGNNIEVVHSNVGYSTFYCLIAAYLEKVPVRLAHSHSSEFGNRKNPVNAFFAVLCKISCHFFATTRINIGRKSAEGLFFRHDASLFVPNGVDLDKFRFDLKARNRIRADFGIPEDALVLICIGRLEAVKNHSYLLEVFRELVKTVPDSWLVIVGSGSLESEIRNKSEMLGLAARVILTGAVSNPQDYCSASDNLVMPSLHEGLSLAMIEAQSNGLMCFTSTDVDRGTAVTDSIEFLDLLDGPEVWATAIARDGGRRPVLPESDKLLMYDKKNNAAVLRRLYLGEVR